MISFLNKEMGAGVVRSSKSFHDMTEDQLLELVRKGQSEAYGEVFTRHREKAFALAFQYLRNYEDAKDVIQDAFIKAYRKFSRFDLSRKFGPWLLTIVRNQCIDAIRKKKRAATQELSPILPDRSAVRADKAVLRKEVWAALQQLSPEHREIIFLKDYQGHSYVEIAEILSIPLGTVMSRLHHARRNLAGQLKERSGMS
jgi:RNA polymerase sigma-70 factor (ECF subfamily)